MKLPQQDTAKRKKLIIVLLITIIANFLLPLIISMWLYLVSIPFAAFCGYLIYRFYLDYHEFTDAKKLCDCVIEKELKKVGDIAKILGWSSARTRRVVEFCFKKGYLDEYFRVGEEICKKDERQDGDILKASAKKSARKCSHCGGVAEYCEGKQVVCVYCGNIIEDNI